MTKLRSMIIQKSRRTKQEQRNLLEYKERRKTRTIWHKKDKRANKGRYWVVTTNAQTFTRI